LEIGRSIFRHDNFPNHWLAFGNETPLVIWQLGNERQFHLLQSRFDASQAIAEVKVLASAQGIRGSRFQG